MDYVCRLSAIHNGLCFYCSLIIYPAALIPSLYKLSDFFMNEKSNLNYPMLNDFNRDTTVPVCGTMQHPMTSCTFADLV